MQTSDDFMGIHPVVVKTFQMPDSWWRDRKRYRTNKVIEIHPLGTENGCTKLRIYPIAIRYYIVKHFRWTSDLTNGPKEKETPHP